MNHNEFFKSVKENRICPVYLFHGEEEYIKEQAFQTLCNLLLPQFSELNLSVFESGSAEEIIASCDSAPFMADKRITLCRFIPKEKDAKKLTEYMDSMPTECVLIFMIQGKADSKLGITKKIKSAGGEVIFDYLTEDDAARWIMQHTSSTGCTVSASNAAFMYQVVGKDMLSIKNELHKLCDYVGSGGVITKPIISDVVIKNTEYQLYSTYSYFVNGKMRDGFLSLESILSGKDRNSEAMGVAGYFLSCLKAALTAYDLLEIKAPQAALEAGTGKRGYALRDLCAISRKFTRAQLLKGIADFSDVAAKRIMLGRSSYNALIDAIAATFSHIKN